MSVGPVRFGWLSYVQGPFYFAHSVPQSPLWGTKASFKHCAAAVPNLIDQFKLAFGTMFESNKKLRRLVTSESQWMLEHCQLSTL